jgi:hypothetical protein
MPGGPSNASDRETLTADFVITITGGTGSGYYVPELTLTGITNETGNLFQAYGASASVNWPVGMQAGDPFGTAAYAPPSILCPGYRLCPVAFTFGVPQQAHFVANTYAALDMSQRGPVSSPMSFTSSVAFDGIGHLMNLDGYALDGKVQIAFAPEPSTIGLTVWGAFIGFCAWKRRPLQR